MRSLYDCDGELRDSGGGVSVQGVVGVNNLVLSTLYDPHAVLIWSNLAADGWRHDHLQVLVKSASVLVVMATENLSNSGLVKLVELSSPQSGFNVKGSFRSVRKVATQIVNIANSCRLFKWLQQILLFVNIHRKYRILSLGGQESFKETSPQQWRLSWVIFP